MKKKLFVVLGTLVFLLIVSYFYLDYRNRSLSPPGETSLTDNGLSIKVNYSRPSVRGRVIFGGKESEALQPFGEYWRLGANEATVIIFNQDVLFNGQPVPAGTYSIYAYPGPDEFDVVLNASTARWGYSEPDKNQDILSTRIKTTTLEQPVEQFTVKMSPIEGGILVSFLWDKTKIPITVIPN